MNKPNRPFLFSVLSADFFFLSVASPSRSGPSPSVFVVSDVSPPSVPFPLPFSVSSEPVLFPPVPVPEPVPPAPLLPLPFSVSSSPVAAPFLACSAFHSLYAL